MHACIANQNWVWRSGVILQKDNTQAEVIEYYNAREIKIRIAGKRKKELMTIITYEIDKIHDSYKHLKCDKLIPCNCATCKDNQEPYFFKYENLRNRVEHGKYDDECDKSFQKVNILELIDDVTDENPLKNQDSKENKKLGDVNIARVDKFIMQQSKEGDNIVEKSNENKQIKSSWANGSFYLLIFIVVIGMLGFVAGRTDLVELTVIIIAGILFIPLIGAFQLQQDDRVSEKNFMVLVKLVIAQLPMLGTLIEKFKKP